MIGTLGTTVEAQYLHHLPLQVIRRYRDSVPHDEECSFLNLLLRDIREAQILIATGQLVLLGLLYIHPLQTERAGGTMFCLLDGAR
jgi:hypothetical protein